MTFYMDVRTVCLALGPYRNLTTLTAGMLSLHPNIQVLNHAGLSIYVDDNLNFLSDYTEVKFRNFVRHAVHLSGGGKRGVEGGSILLSHAFDHERMREKYLTRYGDTVIKDEIHSLFWKESLDTSNLIRANHVDLDAIFVKNQLLRFLMPVRNPMDCAISNLRTRHVQFFLLENSQPSVQEVLLAVLKELQWFIGLQQKHPTRFMLYFENAFEDVWPVEIARFLDVAPDPQWCRDILDVFVIKESYPHSDELRSSYERFVMTLFAGSPKVRDQLLCFT